MWKKMDTPPPHQPLDRECYLLHFLFLQFFWVLLKSKCFHQSNDDKCDLFKKKKRRLGNMQ